VVFFKASPIGFEYHNDAEQTQSAFRGDYFTVGDIGHLSDDGWLYLDDRRVDVINSAGVNVYPAEIEAELFQHPAVADVGVIGIPDEDWGQRVVALIQTMPGVKASDGLAAELDSYARTTLAGYKVPRRIEFRDSLPRTSMGKLSRTQLREGYLVAECDS
jgi:long-chain acyl-CoA synthetase